ncbi:hypothetical protein VP01_1050g2 [Puccinia sorghi]|uniref:Uncharacterized protein n=1 Tax=Puccinia sorghi TaxID=27349 RepID=A0A0L6VU53_9BASI|nr:hypothetical protein VP01_1050g2 [Puccinia sorghi]
MKMMQKKNKLKKKFNRLNNLNLKIKSIEKILETVDSNSFHGLWDVAQSKFYLNQGFLDEINRVAQRIHLKELGPFFYYGKSLKSGNILVFKMKDENSFPAAQLENNWEQIATPEAMQWENKYLWCFELNQRLELETGFDKCTF